MNEKASELLFQVESFNMAKKKILQKNTNVDIIVDDASRLLRRAKYLLSKIKKEQNLLDAYYGGDGWKGHSKEKIRPEKELEKARKKILECKLSIRDAIRQLDSVNSVGSNSKFCECKLEIVEATNAYLGTQFSLDTTWQDVFKEEAAIPDGDNAAVQNPEEDWPSDDPEDEDYDPERINEDCDNNINTDQGNEDNTSDDSSSYSSSSMWSLNGCIDSDESGEIACHCRWQRKAVDYVKLYEEMFGKDGPPCEEGSEDDEDWSPGKRRQREKKSNAVNTHVVTQHESENKCPSNKYIDRKREGSSVIQVKKPCFRIPQDAVEKLRQVFAENELPPKSVKEKISKELGLDAEKVNNWFKNARYMAQQKTKKLQAEGGQQLQGCTSKTSKDSRSQNLQKDEFLKSKVSKITRENVKNVTGKEKMKSSSSPLKKKRQPLREISNKDSKEVSDGVSLKKLLKERKKRVTFTSEGDSQKAKIN